MRRRRRFTTDPGAEPSALLPAAPASLPRAAMAWAAGVLVLVLTLAVIVLAFG